MNKVKGVLPANTDLNAATAGFKNFGAFMSAVNVSNNLGIEFADLKAALTGTTLSGVPTTSGATAATGAGTTSSLGQAIQRLKPGVDATAEAQRAQAQATLETGETSTTNTTSTTSTSSPTSTTSTSSPTSRSSGKGKSK